MGGDVLFDEFMNMGMPVEGFKFTNSSKHQLFLEYAVALEKETTSFPPEWDKLQIQLEGFEVTSDNSSGMFRYRQVDNGHDDWLDAEALALRACDPAVEEGSGFKRPKANISGVKAINGANTASSTMMNIQEARYDQWLAMEQEPEDITVNGEPVRLN
jgi:hypothetical protein